MVKKKLSFSELFLGCSVGYKADDTNRRTVFYCFQRDCLVCLFTKYQVKMGLFHEVNGVYKGTFRNQKQLARKLNIMESLKKRNDERRSKAAQRLNTGNITTTMRRVVEIAQLAKDLWCRSCNEVISLRNLEREEQRGLHFIMYIKCQRRESLIQVHTAKPSSQRYNASYDVNFKLATGR